VADPAAAPAEAAAEREAVRRYIIPHRQLRLQGENDQTAWSIFLTAQQALQPARIAVSYKNALVVMPEVSRLRVSLNGRVVIETPLASSNDFRSVTAAIPAGLLQAGANLLRFQAVQRHRTDCSVQSTYELWTEIDPAQTVLTFEPQTAGLPPIETLEDLPALGYDARGRTTIHMIAPRANETAIAPMLLTLSQSLALFGGFPNPAVIVNGDMKGPDGTGTLTVLVAPEGELDERLGQGLPAAANQPIVSFVEAPEIGTSVLVVSGANWGQIGAAIDAVAQRVNRPLGVTRSTLNTASWFAPDVHIFGKAMSISLNQLGIVTQQFSGRRFRVEFGVGIPSDFYAEAYGEATLLLDAAYTAAVEPASHVDVYVNDEIAATIRIVSRSGGIFRHFPIQIPLRHFHPGVNRVTLEAVLQTAADRVCAPGGSAAGPDRFVLFDTSEFSMPDYARIGRRPNLAAFAGTGYPYNRVPTPSALVLGRTESQTIGAASTLLARLAMQAGRLIPLVVTPLANVGSQPAIFVGSLPQIPAGVLSRFRISEQVRTTWRPEPSFAADEAGEGSRIVAALPADTQTVDTDVLFDRWRTELSDGGGWRGQISGVEDWLKRTFDISFAALRLGPAAAVDFRPGPRSSLLLAQASSPDDLSAWTLLTAPSDEQLAAATRSLVAIETWSAVSGQFSTYSLATGRVESQAPTSVDFIETRPLSLQNARLIAANWLSSNILFYAIGLIVCSVLLGIATSGLLHRLGRTS